MGKVIGIDLGTTNTAIAVFDGGRPRVLEDDRGYRVLPSCVSVKDDGKFIVGQAARSLVLTRPSHTVYAVKRLIGRRYDSVEAEEARRRMPYPIHPAADGGCLVAMGDDNYTPTEISALILQVARGIAERSLGDTVDEVVLTVPAYFNHAQRAATFEAARLAGLKCDRLINEPTAAALAYGFRKEVDRTLLIYDLGGGTFDVSVLHLSSGIYEILASRGDTYLGGEDFDFRLVDYLANHFQSESGVNLREDRSALQRLKDAAERAKCELSFTDRTTVLIPRITRDKNLELAVSRLTLESLVDDLVARTLDVTRKVVADAGLKLVEIEDVILVGGQTRMPRVREAVSGLFHKDPSLGVHPEEVVAVGAAVHAGSLHVPGAPPAVLLDITPFDLGIDVAGGLFQPVIQRQSHIPVSAARVFATVHDDQDAVRVVVRQGDSRTAKDNEFLGEFVMSGLTAAPRMETKVEITFRIDSNGMLHISAVEPATGEKKKITVRNYAEVVASGNVSEAIVEGEGAIGPKERLAATSGGRAGGAGGMLAAALGVSVADKVVDEASGGKGVGKLAGFFARAARRARKQDPPTAGAAAPAPNLSSDTIIPEPDLENLTGVPLDEPEELDIEPVDEPLDEHYGLEVLPDPTPPAAPAPTAGRIVLPDFLPPLPDGGFEEPDRLGMDAVDPVSGGLFDDLNSDLDHDDGQSVAVIGLAGERPSWDVRLGGEEAATTPGINLKHAATGDEVSRNAAREFDSAFQGGGETDELPFYSFPDDDLSGGGADLSDGDLFADDDAAPGGVVGSAGPRGDLREPDTLLDFGAPASPTTPAGERRGGMKPPGDVEELFNPGALGMPTEPPLEEAPTDDLSSLLDGAFQDALGEQTPLLQEPPPARRRAPPAPEMERGPPPIRQSRGARPTSGTPERKRKPARLKLAYPRMDALVTEYRENLRRGGCFVRTERPLPVGRECLIEVRAPGLAQPLELFGVVTWSSDGRDPLGTGQEAGMGIEYRLDDGQRQQLERVLRSA